MKTFQSLTMMMVVFSAAALLAQTWTYKPAPGESCDAGCVMDCSGAGAVEIQTARVDLSEVLPDAPGPAMIQAALPTGKPGLFAQPPAKSQPKFWDRQQIIGFAASTGMRAWDAAQTCSKFANDPLWRERWLPTQSCAGVTSLLMTGEAAQTAAQYLLFRTGHRKLERIIPWVSTAVSGVAIGLADAKYRHN